MDITIDIKGITPGEYLQLFGGQETVTKLNQVLAALAAEGVTMSAEFDALTAKVEASITVQESAIALLAGLAQQIRDLGNAPSPAQITALADEVDAETQKLAAALTANTPAAPPIP